MCHKPITMAKAIPTRKKIVVFLVDFVFGVNNLGFFALVLTYKG